MAPNDTAPLMAAIDALDEPAPVVGSIGPAEPDSMTALGLLLKNGLPADYDPYGKDAFGLTHDPALDTPATPEPTPEAANPLPPNEPPAEPPVPKALYAGVVPIPAPRWWQDELEHYRAEWQIEKGTFGPRDHERRADLEPLEFLLAYRAHLVERLAPLAAMHKHEGKWDEVRRAIRGMIAAEIRKEPKRFGFTKDNPSVEAVTDAACADPRYVAAVRRAREEAIEYEGLNHELAALDARIRAREIANLQYNAETRLQ